ncbi:MAG: ChaN family lipoprotein [Planctomycetes bacterium]|nr:ChaN family lipoprotein [Planctomycetota bacterium]
MSSRVALIRIQRRCVRALKREIASRQGRQTPSFVRYAREYQRDFRRIRRAVSRDDIARRVDKAGIIYVGDFHTLKLSQLTAIQMMKEVLRSGRRPTLLLEMIRAQDQGALDAFLELRIFEEEFLRRIRYERSWGFDWNHYKNLFYFAMAHRIPVIGFDDERRGGPGSLRRRDAFGARRIASIRAETPDATLVVLCGDLHVASAHLPQAVDEELARLRLRARRVIVHQNNESIYWRLAERGMAEDVRAVELDRDVFCLINSTPLVVYQSYLDWTERSIGIAPPATLDFRDDEPRIDGEAHVRRMLGILADFLGIPRDGLDDFTVYDGTELDFFDVLRDRHGFAARDLSRLERELLAARSSYIPKGNVLYLATPSVNHTAEAVSQLVHARCSGDDDGPRDVRGEFYFRIVRQTLGFLGSKIVNPKRVARDIRHYRAIARVPLAPDAPPSERESWRVACTVAEHERVVAAHRRKGVVPSPRSAPFGSRRERLREAATAIGQDLGERIYQAIVSERVRRQEARALYFASCSSTELAFGVYRRLCDLAERGEG